MEGDSAEGQVDQFWLWGSTCKLEPEECDKPQVSVESQEGEERAPDWRLCPRGATERHREQPYELGTSRAPYGSLESLRLRGTLHLAVEFSRHLL